ncbi:MAG: glycerate kinase, partial [Pyramidobacter sp.]|nr:glycerate kinase [Pyramidobacter sp.]
AVFAPQKGVSPEVVARLDAGLRIFAAAVERATGRSVLTLPGGGAAGGAGAGLTGLLGAKLTRGIDMLAAVAGLDGEIEQADVIFTGEGRIDLQTSQGKVISGLAARAKAAEVPLIAIVGCIRGHIGPLMSMGLTAVFPTASGPCTTAQSFQHSREDLERTASQVMRVMRGALRHQAAKRRKYRENE